MSWVVPDASLTWQGMYHYQFDSVGLVQNDKNPGVATDIRELFVQKTDLAKVEEKQYHVGGGIFDTRLEWEEPVNDERARGSKACSGGWPRTAMAGDRRTTSRGINICTASRIPCSLRPARGSAGATG